MTATYTVTEVFAASVCEIKNPWFIVNADSVVGVYAGRAAARAAKAAGWNGKIVPLTEIVLTVSKDEVSKPYGYEDHGLTHCPSCGIHLDNGVGVHNQEINGKKIKHDEFEYCCLACDTEFGPAIVSKKGGNALAAIKPPKNTSGKRNRSNVEKPVTVCWNLFDEMKGGRRKDSIAAAVAKGVTFYTAHSQYQLWFQIQKEMKAREEATAAAKAKK